MQSSAARSLISSFFTLMRGSVIGCLLCMGLTACGGAYSQQDHYSTIPATNNPAITRHTDAWQPGARY